MSQSSLQWNFSQIFGDKSPIEEITDVDIVSAVEFDHTGEFLAAGDRGGRVVLFQRSKTAVAEYKFYVEFQSHEPEFDYLKSLEIEEKINKIKWLPRQNTNLFLLTTNDKTIKLWKIFDKRVQQVMSTDGGSGGSKWQSLAFPNYTSPQYITSAVMRKTFANAHAYHINSISLNSDGETFLSADDLRINLWNLSITDQTFNIVDIKPSNMEELTEVVTCAEFHPNQCNLFIYSSSKGTIKLGDMRHSALCDQQAKVFEEEEDVANRSFFSEIISSVSDIKFTKDGQHIISRDYLTLKIWDIKMESRPVETIHIHDYLKAKLCDLYENDCIFDKFECVCSPDGNHLLTGSYHNYFHVYDRLAQSQTSIEANSFHRNNNKRNAMTRSVRNPRTGEFNADNIDFGKKVLHVAWHPSESIVALAATNNLFIYSGTQNPNVNNSSQ